MWSGLQNRNLYYVETSCIYALVHMKKYQLAFEESSYVHILHYKQLHNKHEAWERHRVIDKREESLMVAVFIKSTY